MSRDQRLLALGLRAYLEGFGRYNEKELAAIAAFEIWGPLAARVYEKRMASVLEALSLEEVQAIALGRTCGPFSRCSGLLRVARLQGRGDG